MTTAATIKRRLDRLNGGCRPGALSARDLETLTDDELDSLIADQLAALGIIDTAAYWAMPRKVRWTGLTLTKGSCRNDRGTATGAAREG
jgi:hypothetical protein